MDAELNNELLEDELKDVLVKNNDDGDDDLDGIRKIVNLTGLPYKPKKVIPKPHLDIIREAGKEPRVMCDVTEYIFYCWENSIEPMMKV